MKINIEREYCPKITNSPSWAICVSGGHEKEASGKHTDKQQPNGVRFAHAFHCVTGTSPLGKTLCAINLAMQKQKSRRRKRKMKRVKNEE